MIFPRKFRRPPPAPRTFRASQKPPPIADVRVLAWRPRARFGAPPPMIRAPQGGLPTAPRGCSHGFFALVFQTTRRFRAPRGSTYDPGGGARMSPLRPFCAPLTRSVPHVSSS